MSIVSKMDEPTKNVLDFLSVTGLVAWFLGALPAVSLCLTVLWLIMRAIEGMPRVLDAISDLRDRWNRRSLK